MPGKKKKQKPPEYCWRCGKNRNDSHERDSTYACHCTEEQLAFRHTPDDKRVFVFGSNERGIHGAGAARYAYDKLDARQRVGLSSNLRSYALPTCSYPGVPLELSELAMYVDFFLHVARLRTDLRFFVSEIGTGLAGFSPDEVIPLFRNAPENCDLPPGWRDE